MQFIQFPEGSEKIYLKCSKKKKLPENDIPRRFPGRGQSRECQDSLLSYLTARNSLKQLFWDTGGQGCTVQHPENSKKKTLRNCSKELALWLAVGAHPWLLRQAALGSSSWLSNVDREEHWIFNVGGREGMVEHWWKLLIGEFRSLGPSSELQFQPTSDRNGLQASFQPSPQQSQRQWMFKDIVPPCGCRE